MQIDYSVIYHYHQYTPCYNTVLNTPCYNVLADVLCRKTTTFRVITINRQYHQVTNYSKNVKMYHDSASMPQLSSCKLTSTKITRVDKLKKHALLIAWVCELC